MSRNGILLVPRNEISAVPPVIGAPEGRRASRCEEEMARLRSRERAEKDKTEHVGVNIMHVGKKRDLLQDFFFSKLTENC